MPGTTRALAAAAFALALGGCSGGPPDAPPPVAIPELRPEPQPFRAVTALADGALTVDVPLPGGGTRTLHSVRNREWASSLYHPPPARAGHSNREMLLGSASHGERILLYALVEWSDADPDDYLAAGWWLTYPPDDPLRLRSPESAERGLFIDGPEVDPARPPDLPLSGSASYTGLLGGLYSYTYGRAWGERAGTTDLTDFEGPLSLTADLDRGRVTGCLGCVGPIEIAPGRHLDPLITWRTDPPAALPAGYEVHLNATLGADGAFEGEAVAVTHSEREVVASAGTWRGQLSNRPDADGWPRRAVGSADVLAAEADGSVGRLTGVFDALTPAALGADAPSGDGQ